MKRSIFSLAVVALAASLTGCGPSPQPVVYQQPMQVQPPVVYQQAQQPVIVQHDSGVGTALAAGVAGAVVGGMLANRGSSGSSYNSLPPQQTTVVNKTVINKTYVQAAPAPAAAPVVPARPSYVAPAQQAPSYAPKTTYVQSAPKTSYSSSSSFSRPSKR